MFLNKNPGGASQNKGYSQLEDNHHLDMKNKQINELSDMVKILLEEQRNLKNKLESQELRMRDGQTKNSIVSESIDSSGMMMRKQREITKKASERTRSQNPTQKKTVQSADSKSIHARKLKE